MLQKPHLPLPQPSQPAVEVAPTPPSSEDSEWRVGTLAYTKPGLRRLFSWLLWGDFAWAVRDRILGPVLGLLLKNLQASDKTIGLLGGTIPATINLVLGPVISFRSDRYRSVRGRRLPFLIVSAPAAAVSILGLAFGPMLGEALNRALGAHAFSPNVLALVVLGIWWVAFDLASVVTNSIFGALINDTVPHGVIGRFYGLFRAVSLIVAIAFNYFLLARAETHYVWAFASVAVIYGAGVVLMCLNVREGEYPPPPPAPEGGVLVRTLLSARDYFRECFSKPFYLWFFLAGNLASLATWPVNGFSGAFVKSVGMKTEDFGWYNAASYVVSLGLSYLIGLLADKAHPLRLSIVAIALYGAALPWVGHFATSPQGLGIALLVHATLSGTFFTASASLSQRLLPRKEFAQFASANGLIGSLFSISLPLALGAVLDHFHHDYRLTFYIGSGMSFAALGCLLVVYRYWRRYGGPHHFMPPD